MRALPHLLTAAALALAGTTLAPTLAHACGGFFCSNAAPVFQNAERILFVQTDAETIEAHVQIVYSGPSEDFAWIVPVPSVPELDIGSDWVFRNLEQSTGREIVATFEEVGDCIPSSMADAAAGGGGMDAGMGEGGGVNVIALETVGPFDTAIIGADDVDEMMEWLDTNGYDLPAATAEVLEPYVGGDMVFLALKLTKNADAGDLQPIVMTYDAAAPMIPIELTRIAATNDMPVFTWILADDYARPANYLEVTPTDIATASLDWPTAAQRAIGETGPHAMVRTWAKPTDESFVDPRGSAVRDSLSFIADSTDAWQIYDAFAFADFSLQQDPITLSLMQACLPVPEDIDVDPATFFGCPACFLTDEWGEADGAACFALVEERLLEPRERVEQHLATLGVLSRYDTWLDPEDMTLDPMFCWDDDATALEALEVTYRRYCAPDRYDFDSPRATIVGGVEYFFRSNSELPPAVGGAVRAGCGTAADEVVVAPDAAVLASYAATLETTAEEQFPDLVTRVPDGDGPFAGSTEGGDERAARSGCSAAPVGPAAPLWLAAALAAVLGRRRTG